MVIFVVGVMAVVVVAVVAVAVVVYRAIIRVSRTEWCDIELVLVIDWLTELWLG